MKRVLITGASGFAGGFLAEQLLSISGFDIYGTYLIDESLQKSPVKDKINFRKLDLENKEEVTKLVEETQPNYIYHLAGQAAAGKSFKDPQRTFTANVMTQINLFEAVRLANITPRILSVTSGMIYGLVKPEDLPINELTPFRPSNPYAVSKIAQDYLCLQYVLSYQMPIIRARPFNHIGPRQSQSFAIPDFAKRIVDIEKGLTPPVLKVGNLSAKLDFTDVRDVVRAYVSLMDKGETGEAYNIGSGKSYAISEIVAIMKSESKVPFTIEPDPALMRPVENPEFRCNATKLKNLTGWEPTIPLEQTIKEALDYWRQQ